MAGGMEAEDHLGARGTFDAKALGANGNATVGADLDGGTNAPNIGPPRAARGGLADPRDRLKPAVEPLIELRDTLRAEGDFAAADVIRGALAAAGLDLTDTPDGTRWRDAEAG